MLPLKFGNVPALHGQFLAHLAAFVGDELHDRFAGPDRLFGVVGNAQLEQHVGEAHDAQADLAVRPGHLADLLEGIAVHVDDVVQEVDGLPHGVPQLAVIDLLARGVSILARLMEPRLQDS